MSKLIFRGNNIGIIDNWGMERLANEYESINFLFKKTEGSRYYSDENIPYYEYSSSDTTGYENIGEIGNGPVFIKVKKNGFWGLSNLKGELIAPIEYYSIKVSASLNNEIYFILTKQDGTEIKIDRNGKPTE